MKYLNNTSHNPYSQWLRSLLAAILASLALLGLMVQSAQAADTITYIHSDISGSPLAATDASGRVLWKESYTAFGQKLQRQPASQNHGQSFHGKEWDEETGQQYFGARYYDPAIGRFMGMDPVDYQQGNLHSFNRYAYGNNNPVRYVDPDGRVVIAVVPALLAAGAVIVTVQTIHTVATSPQTKAAARRLGNWISDIFTSESVETLEPQRDTRADNAVPPVPGDLVGDQSSDSAGLTKNGKRHTSGPMTPGNGGTGDASKDFDKLTGGNNQPAGGTYPPGALVGPNGVVLRPGQKGGGARIDIPGNGSKPPETLHY